MNEIFGIGKTKKTKNAEFKIHNAYYSLPVEGGVRLRI